MEDEFQEAIITVNGHALTNAQSMVVRVSLESMAGSLIGGLGNDEHGVRMTALYRERIQEIREYLYK